MPGYKSIARPLIYAASRRDPEIAHEWMLRACVLAQRSAFALERLERRFAVQDPRLAQEFFGLKVPNPVGLAAGVDKNAQAPLIWRALGFAFAELGTVTYHQQEGNPRQRIFRLEKDEALINRMGFNNEGADKVRARLAKLYHSSIDASSRMNNFLFLLSLGKSKITPLEKAVEDYCSSLELLHPFVRVFTTNVSSPNTPELRKLQEKQNLTALLRELRRKADVLSAPYRDSRKSLLVKIAPDLTWRQIDEVLEVSSDVGIDGLIPTNTTISREGLLTPINETGGLSGKPLRVRALEVVKYIRERMGDDFFIIGLAVFLARRMPMQCCATLTSSKSTPAGYMKARFYRNTLI